MTADRELVRGSEDPDAEPIFDEPDNKDSFTKTTVGFVTQTFDKNGKCTHQEFIAGDQVDYNDANGEEISADDVEEYYQSYEMVQPNTEIVIHVEGGLIQNVEIPSGFNDLVVIVKDYDTDGSEDELKEDDASGKYIESRWGNGK